MANYSVFKGEDGDWKAKRDDASRASSSHGTQAEAEKAAKRYSGNSGGGEVSIHGRDGKVRNKDTVAPGNDPRNIPG
ncbi:DUF2188 domain-containing protein [Pseudactinotalea suaedae]|uniref:DUF2188 domain-containing protein n=1 Tax=Pseudactinotalea suaedae TaxID=1524924 RepID=UPI0019D54866|nr:DUF2188 domain-containing protein [Pseudactinotalea suaedae]